MGMLLQIRKDTNNLMDTIREIANKSNSPTTPRNHVDLFFDSISSSIKALSPKLISEAKMRFSQLACELELRAMTEADSASSAAVGQTQVVVAAYPAAVDNSYTVINHNNPPQT